MKSTLSLWIAMSIYILSATSCAKNRSEISQDNSVKMLSEYLGKSVVIDLKGNVLNTDQLPVEKATVRVGDKSVLTDSLGYFMIKNASAHENLLTVNVTKKDYKKELINLTPEGKTTTVNIRLYKENELSLFWFNKNNHNLLHTPIK